MIDAAEEKLYKFGKNWLVELSLRLFYLWGIWPRENSTIIYTIAGYTFQTLTSLAWTIAKSIATVMLEKRTELILLGPTTVYAYTNIYRGFLIMWKHKSIGASLNDVSDLLVTKNEYDDIQLKMKFFNRTSLAYTIFITLGFVSTCLIPIISHGVELPVPIWMPYNDWRTYRRDYIYALIFSYAGIIAMTVICAFTPILCWYLLLTNSLKLHVLGQRLRVLGYNKNNKNNKNKKNVNESLDALFDCIRRHQEIVLNIKQVEDTFAGVFAYQIASSAVCICSTAYLMADSSSGESNSLMLYVGLGGIYIYEICVLIYYANEIALESDELSFHLYESDWTGMPMNYRKTMIIMAEKWKKPLQLVVAKVFPMRINILTSILNVAYSILNVLRKGQ